MTPAEKAEKAAVLRAEADALDRPEPQEYPKWLHFDDGRASVLVADADAEAHVCGIVEANGDEKPRKAGKKK